MHELFLILGYKAKGRCKINNVLIITVHVCIYSQSTWPAEYYCMHVCMYELYVCMYVLHYNTVQFTADSVFGTIM